MYHQGLKMTGRQAVSWPGPPAPPSPLSSVPTPTLASFTAESRTAGDGMVVMTREDEEDGEEEGDLEMKLEVSG